MAEEEKKDPKAEEAKKRKAFLRQERAKRNIQQCVLGENLEKVLDFFRGEGQREVFNYRTFRQVSGAPPQIVTALRGTSDLECFYNIKTSTLSLLQPKIRLFKVRSRTQLKLLSTKETEHLSLIGEEPLARTYPRIVLAHCHFLIEIIMPAH